MRKSNLLQIILLLFIVLVSGSVVWLLIGNRDGNQNEGNNISENQLIINAKADILKDMDFNKDVLGDPEVLSPEGDYEFSTILLEGDEFVLKGFSDTEGGWYMAGGCRVSYYNKYWEYNGEFYFLDPREGLQEFFSAFNPETEEEYILTVSAMDRTYPPQCGPSEAFIYLETKYFEPTLELGDCPYDPIDLKGGLNDEVFEYYREVYGFPYKLVKTSVSSDNDGYNMKWENVYECEDAGVYF